MIIVCTYCPDLKEAEKIGKYLLEKRLCACVSIIPGVKSFYFWPPKKGKIESSKEAVLLIKTVEDNYQKIEKEITKIHSYKVPLIFSLKPDKFSKKYFSWLKEEIK